MGATSHGGVRLPVHAWNIIKQESILYLRRTAVHAGDKSPGSSADRAGTSAKVSMPSTRARNTPDEAPPASRRPKHRPIPCPVAHGPRRSRAVVQPFAPRGLYPSAMTAPGRFPFTDEAAA